MLRLRRRAVWALAAVVLAMLAGGAVLFAVTSGEDPDDVAADYLEAHWLGDWRTECDLATTEWRRYLYEGFPFADCGAYAEAARRAEAGTAEGADEGAGFAAYRDDTGLVIDAVTRSEDGGRARVEYVVEFRYDGADPDGFEDLWQGGGAVDRGTVELVEVEGEWRIAGVDGG